MFEEGIKGWSWCVWEGEEIDSSPTTNDQLTEVCQAPIRELWTSEYKGKYDKTVSLKLTFYPIEDESKWKEKNRMKRIVYSPLIPLLSADLI